jgi:hypothetical protein
VKQGACALANSVKLKIGEWENRKKSLVFFLSACRFLEEQADAPSSQERYERKYLKSLTQFEELNESLREVSKHVQKKILIALH